MKGRRSWGDKGGERVDEGGDTGVSRVEPGGSEDEAGMGFLHGVAVMI
jgi:hypothetical protein